MEAHEATELIEHGHGHENNKTAFIISFFAMVLAIAALGGANATKEATKENILASNAHNFYQAKVSRQQALSIASTNLEIKLAEQPTMSTASKGLILQKLEEYKKNIQRYESDPENKEGKKELLLIAKEHEMERDHAIHQDPWFDCAESILQIAIVILSVSILGSIPALVYVGSLLGIVGLLSTINGFLLIFHF